MYYLSSHNFTLQLGYQLVFLCEKNREGNLLAAITGLRRALRRDLEVVIPQITIRDNIDLEAGEYALFADDQEISRGEVFPDYLAAFSCGNLGIEFLPNSRGVTSIDPASKRRIILIRPEYREFVEGQGYLVVEALDLLISHLSLAFVRFAHASTAYDRKRENG